MSMEARFAAFVEEHRDRAVRLAWRLGAEDLASAEEIAQEAFLHAHAGLRRFRNEAQISTWFYRILFRQADNYRRKRERQRKWRQLFHLEPKPVATQISSEPGLGEIIAAAMEALSPGQREIFTLVYLEGFQVAEAAAITGRATGTAKSHLHRALTQLRSALGATMEEIR
jgi:RNA polymerase sigma-70 factor (ECF subfamily)